MIKVVTDYDSIRIYFGDTLHLRLYKDMFLGLQAYRSNDTYTIEYYMVGNKVLTEYTDIERWKEVLLQLDKIAIYRNDNK